MKTAPVPPPPPLAADWPTLGTLVLRYVDRVLERAAGNKTEASRILDVDRRTLNRALARAPRERHRPR